MESPVDTPKKNVGTFQITVAASSDDELIKLKAVIRDALGDMEVQQFRLLIADASEPQRSRPPA